MITLMFQNVPHHLCVHVEILINLIFYRIIKNIFCGKYLDFICNHCKGYNGYIFIPTRKYKIYLYNM